MRSGYPIDTNIADIYGNKRRTIITSPAAFNRYPVWDTVNNMWKYHIVPGSEPRAARIVIQ